MKIFNVRHRVWLSLLLSVSLVVAFSLSSFAASDVSSSEEAMIDSLLIPQALTGTLTTHGPVLVNGIEAKTGATIANDSVIQTLTGGHAMIDLGPAGRVELDPLTTIRLSMTNTTVDATLDKCGMGVELILPAGVTGTVKIHNIADVGVLKEKREVDVRVKQGQALVKYGQGQERTLKAGDHREFDNAIDVTATGVATFKVYCDENHYPYFLLLGLAALIPIAEELSGGGPLAPSVSPLQP